MSTTQTNSNSIEIIRPRCPKCGARVKQRTHKGDVRYFDCQCGNQFKGYVK